MSASDLVLLEKWRQNRDADAFAEIVNRYAGMVYTIGKRILGDSTQAEDLAQECFVELMQSRNRITSSLGGWLHTVALRRGMDQIKRESRRRKRDEHFSTTTPHELNHNAEEAELLARVDAAIGELPEKLKAAIIARFLEGQSHTEAARLQGVTESAIRNRIDQGILRIRKGLQRQGIPVASAVLLAILEAPAEAAPQRLTAQLGKLALANVVPATPPMGMALVVKSALIVIALAGIGTMYWVLRPNGVIPPLQTDPEVESLLASGTNPVSPNAESAMTEEPEPVTQNAAEATLEEPEPFSISGRVYDKETGQGIANVRISAYPEGGGISIQQNEPTGPDGVYTFPPMSDGTYGLSVSTSFDTPNRYPRSEQGSTTSVTLKDGIPLTGIDFPLKKGILIAGTVTDSIGNPVGGVDVGAKTESIINAITTKSDTTGAFELYMPSPTSSLRIQARSETSDSMVYTGLKLTEAGLDNLHLQLDHPRDAIVSGIVIDGNGAPIPSANINLRHIDERIFTTAGRAITDENGTFKIADVSAGTVSFIVTPKGTNGYSTNEECMRLDIKTSEQIRDIEIVYGEKGGLAIAGNVVDNDGNPIQGARLRSVLDMTDFVYTDENGWFQITGLKDRDYEISIAHDDYSQTQLKLAAGTLDIQIVLQDRGSLFVRASRAGTGEILTKFTVGLVYGKVSTFDNMLFSMGHEVESRNGTYTTGKIQAGDVSVAAWAPGFAPEFQIVEVTENSVTEVDFRLKPVPLFTGTVTNSQGEPVKDAGIYFVQGVFIDTIERAFATRSDADGQFTLDILPDNATRVCAYHPNYGVGIAHLPYEHNIVLPSTASLDGVVLLENNDENKCFVTISYPNEDNYIPIRSLRTDADGAFRLDGLTPGEASVNVTTSGTLSHMIFRTVNLIPDQKTHVEFVCENGVAIFEGTLLNENTEASVALISVDQEHNGLFETWRGTPNQNGTFRFENLWPGPLTLTVIRATPQDAYTPITDIFEVTIGEEGLFDQIYELSNIE